MNDIYRQGGRNTESDLFGENGKYTACLSKDTAGKACPRCGETLSLIHISFTLRNKATTRSLIEFNIDVQETNSCLQIIFLSPLPDAEITITDKNGKTVVHEPPTFINKGKTLYHCCPIKI